MKYLVDVSLLTDIRDFVSLFCHEDPHTEGDPPEYTVTTLQFDNVFGDLNLMKENKALNRFKLRARAYGDRDLPAAPLSLEIKRRLNDVIVKSRATVKPGWSSLEEILFGNRMPDFLRDPDRLAFHEFMRLYQEIDAHPVMLVRYRRESWISDNDGYARVTFDREMRYHPQNRFDLDPVDSWRTMDSLTAVQRPYPAFVLEIKSTGHLPTWMAELIERFNLVRCDFCKYATAMRLESLYRGHSYSDASENTTYRRCNRSSIPSARHAPSTPSRFSFP